MFRHTSGGEADGVCEADHGEAAENDERPGAPVELRPAAEVERSRRQSCAECRNEGQNKLSDEAVRPPRRDHSRQREHGNSAKQPKRDAHGAIIRITYDSRNSSTVSME